MGSFRTLLVGGGVELVFSGSTIGKVFDSATDGLGGAAKAVFVLVVAGMVVDTSLMGYVFERFNKVFSDS